MNELERWANFYRLMSGSAATLLGLMFVVITFSVGRRPGDAAKIHIYLTPTVIYFASVLCLAALLSFPNHTRLTASLCTCLGGFAGLVYSGSFFRIVRGGKRNYYELQDWIVSAVVPFAAYGVQIFGGVLLFRAPQRGLTLVPRVCCRCLRLPFATRGPSLSMSSLCLVGSKTPSSTLRNFQTDPVPNSQGAKVIRRNLQGVKSS